MRSVKATNASSKLKVRIKELGRIANEGEIFRVTDERFAVLNGANRFKAIFVVPNNNEDKVSPVVKPEDVKPKQVNIPKVSKPKNEVKTEPQSAKIDTTIVDEQPEIWLIEPGKAKVRVDENLNPIVENTEEVVEAKPKRKRGRPRKSTIEQKVEEISIQE